MKKSVLVLGAGYGGIFAAANLCRERLFDVTLIDRNQYHQLLQQIHFIVSRLKTTKDITIPVEDLFRNYEGRGLVIHKATVSSIDLNAKRVNILMDSGSGDGSSSLGYDYLVIALGAETQYFGVKGAEEHCLAFRSVQDARKIKEKIESLHTGACIIIAGGGPTGVSLAAAVLELPALIANKLTVTIVDSSNVLLPGWDARLSATANKLLAARGAKIVTGKTITRVDPGSVSFESGEQLPADCTIWAAGVKGCNIEISPQVERTKSGRLVVDRFSRIPRFNEAFALGDISEFKIVASDGNTTAAPQLAQFAVRQARFVADNICRTETAIELNEVLNFCQRGHTIALGEKSIGLLGGLLVTGKICDYAEDSIVDNFVTEIKKRDQGISAIATAAEREIETTRGDIYHPNAFDFVTYATSKGFLDLVH